MRHNLSRGLAGLATLFALTLAGQSSLSAQENIWRVTKMSGDAWVTASGVQAASLSQEISLKPGDVIRTGRSGRVLLVRGAESMLVSPNSSISIPESGRAGISTIIQQAGSILLDVEKKNVQHFEVETPYLAAVVKGTRFRVTIAQGRANVLVERGQVQVSDFRSGQYALVLPGQTAQVAPALGEGLKLSGNGALGRIEQGQPQIPRVAPLSVPRGGLAAPAGARPLNRGDAPAVREARKTQNPAAARVNAAAGNRPVAAGAGISRGPNGALRISASLGEVKLDIGKVTNGLVSDGSGNASGGSAGARATVWDKGSLNPAGTVKGNGGGSSGSASAASGNGSSSVASIASGTVSAAGVSTVSGQTTATSGNAGSNGNGNSGNGNSGTNNAGGNGNGNGNGNSGTSNAGGNGNSGTNNAGGNGNGNGNSGGNRYGYGQGNGNGLALGKLKNGK